MTDKDTFYRQATEALNENFDLEGAVHRFLEILAKWVSTLHEGEMVECLHKGTSGGIFYQAKRAFGGREHN